MAAQTWYATNNLASVHQELSETNPGAEAYASPVTGWIVSTGGTNHSAFLAQVERAASTFVDAAPPDGSIDTTNGDCLRTATTYNGDFASANWNVHFACRANTNGGAQDGRMRCRLFRSANADGSGATEITAAQQQGGLVTNLATSATQTSTATFNPGAFTVTNEYIFVQLAWERTGAGGMTSSDVNMRIGVTTGTRVISADFTAAANHYTLTGATGALALSGGAATLKSARQLAGATGALLLSGGTAVFAAARRLVGATGALVLTGGDAVLDYSGGADPVLVGDTGALVLTGGAATLRASRRLLGATGALTLFGGVANLVYSGAGAASGPPKRGGGLRVGRVGGGL